MMRYWNDKEFKVEVKAMDGVTDKRVNESGNGSGYESGAQTNKPL